MLRRARMRKITNSLLQHLIRIELLKESSFGLQKIYGDVKMSKLFWLLVITGCFVGLSFQTYTRIAYFFRYPVAVDVHNVYDGQVPFPSLMLCSYDTPPMAEIWKKTEMPLPSAKFNWNCVNEFYSLIKYSNLSIDQLYRAANMSSIRTELSIKKKRNVALNVNYKYISTPFGICMLVELDGDELNSFSGSSVSIKLHKPQKDVCGREAPYFLSSIPSMHTPSLKYAVAQISGTKMGLWFGKTKYTFVNSPLNHCVDEDTFSKCMSECLIDHLKNGLTCRFPFTPSEVEKPTCVDRQEAEAAYSKTLDLYGDLDSINDCHCPKRCQELIHHLNAEAFLIEGQTPTSSPCDMSSTAPCYTEIELLFIGNERTEFEERRVYSFAALLADFGANLSFFLGLSALSLLDNLQNYWKFWSLKQKTKKFARYRKMLRLSQLVLRKTVARERETVLRKRKMKLVQIVHCVMIVISIWSIYNRLCLYWHEPVNTVVVTVQADAMQFPDVTVCGEEADLSEYRAKRMQETGQDSCQFVPWELLDYLPIEELWELLSLDGSILPEVDVFKYYGTPSITRFERSSVELPFGQCSKFVSPMPTKFRGSWSLGTIIMLRFDSPDEYCAKGFFKYFVTPRGEPIDLTAINSMPLYTASGLWIEEKRVYHMDAKSKPCMANEIYFKCIEECLEKKLALAFPKIPCRLPYMREDKFPLCNSSRSALTAHSAYMRVYQESKTSGDCKCSRRCEETYYVTRVYNPPTVEHITFFNYLFHSNLIEIVVDVMLYPFSAFLSDIGSILGLTIGFSLLSFFDYLVELKRLIWGYCAHTTVTC